MVTVVADKLKRQSSQEANRVHNGEHVQTIVQDKTVKGQNCTGNRSRHASDNSFAAISNIQLLTF